MRHDSRLIVSTCLLAFWNAPAFCSVLPMMGGGQIGMANASMKHIDILFDGSQLTTHIDPSIDTPMLRPLQAPDRFDDTAPWSVLQEKAYNFQFGWNAGGFISLPAGTGIWVELLETSPRLEVYSRPPAEPSWEPILGTDESSPRWKWSGSMTHNVYAVLDPLDPEYMARYRVYVGNATTGDPVEGIGSASVTLSFRADPLLLGDFNDDGQLTAVDIDLLTIAIADRSTRPRYDVNRDDIIDLDDHRYWVTSLKQTWVGDANLDGRFDTDDLVRVFQAGKYEDDSLATWAEGDWNGDRHFNTLDFVDAFQDGGYGQGTREIAAVPEPYSLLLFTLNGLCLLCFRRKARSDS